MTQRHADRHHPVRRRALRPALRPFAEGVVAREQDHELPRAQVRDLLEAGFGRLRCPSPRAGRAGPRRVRRPPRRPGRRGLRSAAGVPRAHRLGRAGAEPAAGEYRRAGSSASSPVSSSGNAWSEVGDGVTGRQQTVVTTRDGRTSVSGRKYYTTGTIFADWTDATARRRAPGRLLRDRDRPRAVHAEGASVSDDWDGSGSSSPAPAPRPGRRRGDAADVAPFTDRFRYQTALYQLVLLAVHAGIAAAVERDTGAQVRGRTRSYTPRPRPARPERRPGAVGRGGDLLDRLHGPRPRPRCGAGRPGGRRHRATCPARTRPRGQRAGRDPHGRSQVVLSETVPRAATLLFNTLGASGTSRAKDLDRHWRNARTVASHNRGLQAAHRGGLVGQRHRAALRLGHRHPRVRGRRAVRSQETGR